MIGGTAAALASSADLLLHSKERNVAMLVVLLDDPTGEFSLSQDLVTSLAQLMNVPVPTPSGAAWWVTMLTSAAAAAGPTAKPALIASSAAVASARARLRFGFMSPPMTGDLTDAGTFQFTSFLFTSGQGSPVTTERSRKAVPVGVHRLRCHRRLSSTRHRRDRCVLGPARCGHLHRHHQLRHGHRKPDLRIQPPEVAC
jgi:hypothetical protein